MGEIFGVLHASKNISFDKLGYAQLSRRPVATVYNVTNFDTMVSCVYLKDTSNSGYYAMTGIRPFMFNLDGSAPTDLNGSGHGGDIKYDGVVWQGRWYISQGTSFAYYVAASASWTTGLGSLNSPVSGGAGHAMCVWESANYLAIGDHNQVLLYDTSHTLQKTITLPSNFEVRWIRYNHNRIYIGTKNKNGGDAMMFVCSDITSSSAADSWPVPANWIFSGIPYKSSIAVMTSRGQLLWFNGGGWTELANLPVYNTTYSWFQGTGYVNGRMEQRGMATDGNLIFLNLDGYTGDDYLFLEGQPSGLWIFDPAIGLTHRAGISLDKYNTMSISSLNTGTYVFTAGASFTALSGVKVWYKASTVSTGLENYRYYYLIRKSSTTFQLAKTYADAVAGTPVPIAVTAAGNTETLHCCDELDTGASMMGAEQPGAVCLVSELDAAPLPSATGYGYMTGSQVLYGVGNVTPATGSNIAVVMSLSTGYNRGYIITQKLFSSVVKDSVVELIAKCTRLFQTSDKAIIKYRVVDKLYYPIFVNIANAAQATWVNGTSFTTTRDLSAVVAGDEVEFLAGRGGGLTAHITITPTVSSGTWTVTIDETIPGVTASDVSGFVIQNWKKQGTLSSTDMDWIYKQAPASNPKKWIQLKIELRGHSEPILEEGQVDSNPNE